MLNPELLRNQDKLLDLKAKLATRNFNLDIDLFLDLEQKRKALQIDLETKQAERNQNSSLMAQKKSQGIDISEFLAELSNLSDEIKLKEQALSALQAQFMQAALLLPNIPDASVPLGLNEADNLVLKEVGELPEFNFQPLSHDELGKNLGNMDFLAASKLSGPRFVVLKNNMAKLQRALINFMLDTHVKEHGYEELYLPYLVKSQALIGTGQLPKFAEDQFALADDFWLIPTAEVPATNLVREEILASLPLKYVAHTPCFRRESGSYGRDTKGMIRQHQFEKVELVQIVKAESSMLALEELCAHAEKILELLELPYRRVALCSGDLGFAAAKTYDLEVWLPSFKTYREISSCSNYLDFQARRMQTRIKLGKNTQLVHTINGSGLAVGRTLVAILENYQDANGQIRIPKVLQAYMGGAVCL